MDYDERDLQAVREGRLLIDRYDAWLFEEFQPYLGQRVLEVGCGLGNLMRHLTDRQLLVGIEPSAESVAAVRRQFAAYPQVEAHELSITDPAVLALEPRHFDCAISLNVFEHIEADDLALRHTWQLLQPGGRLILIVPAHDWLYGRMDAAIGHYRRYTKALLADKLQAAGFSILRQQYLNMVGALGWLANGRVLRRRVPPTGQLQLFNRLVPGIRAFEKRFGAPFGITVMCIAQKPLSPA